MKGNKILAMVLCIAMVLSTMTIGVFAAETTFVPVYGQGVDFEKNGGVVSDGTNYYPTLAAALKGVLGTDASLWCKAGADLGQLTHGDVSADLTIYGNKAKVTSGEHDMAIDTYQLLKEDITVNVYSLDGIAAWGQRNTDYTANLNFYNCDDMNRVYLSGSKGVNNINLNNCSFNGTSPCSVYSNANGTVNVTGCTFTNVMAPVNINQKGDGDKVVNVTDCEFIDCATTDIVGNAIVYAAPVRVKSETTAVALNVDACTFTYSTGKEAANGDILIGDGRVGDVSEPVALTVTNTAAEVQIHQPGERTATSNTGKVVEVANSATATAIDNGVAKINDKVYTTLASAIDAAKNGDTVVVKGGTYSLPTIQKNITISEANNEEVIFAINSEVETAGAELIFNDITFKYAENSSYKGLVRTASNTYNNCTILGQAFLYGNTETFNNCTFTTTDSNNYNVWTYGAAKVAFNECTFNSAGKSVLVYHESVGNEVVVNNCEFNASASVKGKAAVEIGSEKAAFVVEINDSTANGFDNGSVSGNTLWNNKIGTTADNKGVLVIVDDEIVAATNGTKDITNTVVAKVGTWVYDSLDAAVKAAEADATITDINVTLHNDAELANVNFGAAPLNLTKPLSININDNTLALKSDNRFTNNVKFYNGNIIATENNGTASVWTYAGCKKVELNDVNVTSTGLNGMGFINVESADTVVDIIDSEITATNHAFSVIYTNNATVNITNSVMDFDNIGRAAFWFGNYYITDSEITMDNVASTVDKNTAYGALFAINAEISNSDITVNNSRAGISYEDNPFGAKTVNLKNGSVVTVTNSTKYDAYLPDETYAINELDTAQFNGDIEIAEVSSEAGLTEEITVVFEKKAQDTYDMYLIAEEGAMNRVSAAQLRFKLAPATGVKMGYEIAPADGIAITEDLEIENAYAFNLDGAPLADRTGEKVMLGTVTFDGVGEFDFVIDTEYKNQVHTASLSDNIELAYTVGSTVNRVLNLGTGIDGEIVEATRNLVVNIAFNNEIKDQSVAYTDMKVRVVGSNGYDETISLGADDNTYGDTVTTASVDFGAVAVPYRYTVTVTGAGYRTATATAVVGDDATTDFTFNFWNNVKDDANTSIFVGGDTMTKNFLAGDIVKDNTINKYDLSAVVSYFGTRQAATSLNKYDLNRDGNIDSEDIAYVLVSFGE